MTCQSCANPVPRVKKVSSSFYGLGGRSRVPTFIKITLYKDIFILCIKQSVLGESWWSSGLHARIPSQPPGFDSCLGLLTEKRTTNSLPLKTDVSHGRLKKLHHTFPITIRETSPVWAPGPMASRGKQGQKREKVWSSAENSTYGAELSGVQSWALIFGPMMVKKAITLLPPNQSNGLLCRVYWPLLKP